MNVGDIHTVPVAENFIIDIYAVLAFHRAKRPQAVFAIIEMVAGAIFIISTPDPDARHRFSNLLDSFFYFFLRFFQEFRNPLAVFFFRIRFVKNMEFSMAQPDAAKAIFAGEEVRGEKTIVTIAAIGTKIAVINIL